MEKEITEIEFQIALTELQNKNSDIKSMVERAKGFENLGAIGKTMILKAMGVRTETETRYFKQGSV